VGEGAAWLEIALQTTFAVLCPVTFCTCLATRRRRHAVGVARRQVRATVMWGDMAGMGVESRGGARRLAEADRLAKIPDPAQQGFAPVGAAVVRPPGKDRVAGAVHGDDAKRS